VIISAVLYGCVSNKSDLESDYEIIGNYQYNIRSMCTDNCESASVGRKPLSEPINELNKAVIIGLKGDIYEILSDFLTLSMDQKELEKYISNQDASIDITIKNPSNKKIKFEFMLTEFYEKDAKYKEIILEPLENKKISYVFKGGGISRISWYDDLLYFYAKSRDGRINFEHFAIELSSILDYSNLDGFNYLTEECNCSRELCQEGISGVANPFNIGGFRSIIRTQINCKTTLFLKSITEKDGKLFVKAEEVGEPAKCGNRWVKIIIMDNEKSYSPDDVVFEKV
jgi:hypothetical protein